MMKSTSGSTEPLHFFNRCKACMQKNHQKTRKYEQKFPSFRIKRPDFPAGNQIMDEIFCNYASELFLFFSIRSTASTASAQTLSTPY